MPQNMNESASNLFHYRICLQKFFDFQSCFESRWSSNVDRNFDADLSFMPSNCRLQSHYQPIGDTLPMQLSVECEVRHVNSPKSSKQFMFACKNESLQNFLSLMLRVVFDLLLVFNSKRFVFYSSPVDCACVCVCVWLCLTIYATKSLSTRLARRCSHRIFENMSKKAHEFEVVKLSTHETRVEKWNKCNLFIDSRGIRITLRMPTAMACDFLRGLVRVIIITRTT